MLTVIHLVHGTWPYGLRGRRPAAEGTAWTNEGSPFRSSIAGGIATPVTFREFCWSGKNSFRARAIAALDFRTYLENAVHDMPHANHIVIAHSHGGTIAMHALAAMTTLDSVDCPVREVIFLATPFTYLTARRSHTFTNSLGCFIVGATLGYILPPALAIAPGYMHSGSFEFIIAMVLALPLFILFSIGINAGLALFPSLGIGYCMKAGIPSNIPVRIFRGTRDEAALAIGFFQSLNVIGEKIVGLGGKDRGAGRRAFIGFFLLLSFLFGVDWGFLTIGIIGLLPSVLHSAVLGSTIFPSAGRYDIDVDAAPPDRASLFRSFHQLTPSSLRHALHEDSAVRKAIVDAIKERIKQTL